MPKIKKVFNSAKNAGFDGFLLTLMALIGIAYVWPQPGMRGAAIPFSTISSFGVSVVFFFYGLKLNSQILKEGLSNWKLHVVIHVATFIIFPLLAFLVKPVLVNVGAEKLWFAVFFLSALPSTVSSSVVMVSIAHGNVPAAIFNASISSLLGVFVTPVWMAWATKGEALDFDLSSVVLKLSLQVLLPVSIGMGLNKTWGRWAKKNSVSIRYLDQASILLIVYTSFCESFGGHFFKDFSVTVLLFLGLGMFALFFGMYFLLTFICKGLGFSRDDQTTAVFCGSKKSLVQGAVMSKVLFEGATAGFMLLPIMVYHSMQLILASIIARRIAGKVG